MQLHSGLIRRPDKLNKQAKVLRWTSLVPMEENRRRLQARCDTFFGAL